MSPRVVSIPSHSGGFRNRLRLVAGPVAGPICLVERTNPETGGVHWEVWRLRWQPSRPGPEGKVLRAGWRLPSTAEWGEHGWTYATLPEARERYRALVAPMPQKGGSTAERGA